MQSLEYVRDGGQLYVAGHPPYTAGGGYDPLWVGLALDTVGTPTDSNTEDEETPPADDAALGETRGDPLPLFDSSLLGPVLVASYTSSAKAGEPLGIKVDFQTNLGVTTFEPPADTT